MKQILYGYTRDMYGICMEHQWETNGLNDNITRL